jgi:ribose transport system ATP-binding protein
MSAASQGQDERDRARRPPPLLELREVSKSFHGVRVLDRVSLAARAGEVVALVGENGAGKSTLLKGLGGIHAFDEGQIRIEGRAIRWEGVRQAASAGIRLIHQEPSLAGTLSVAENVFLGQQPYRGAGWLPLTDRRRMTRLTADLLQRVGLDGSPQVRVDDLSIGQRQLVDIARALASDARLIAFDEPTSSLSRSEAGRLLQLIRQLRTDGAAVLYVSHRLGEVQEIADRVVVLRDGRLVGELEGDAIDHDRMASLMIGRAVRATLPRARRRTWGESDALRVRDLRYPAAAEPMSFHVARGEIVGFTGLVGAGRTELARALFGVDPVSGGTVAVAGRPVRIRGPRDAIAAGLFLVPEDRKTQGLLLQDSLADNIALAALSRLAHLQVRRKADERRLARHQADRLAIHAGIDQAVYQLSGGNQQKVVLAKWLAMAPRLLILDEPTRGVDVGAKGEIYRLMSELADSGIGILMISSDMEEIIALCDRVLVMRRGRITGQLDRASLDEPSILALALGDAP